MKHTSKIFRILVRMLSGYGLGRIPFIAKFYFLLGKKILPDFIVFKGNKIFLDSENSINLATAGYESEQYELMLFESEIAPSSIVIDIGASIGVYTLVAAMRASKVYSFEADPVTFLNLKKNVKGNNLSNVVTINKAVTDRSGKSKFLSSSNKSSRSGNHLVAEFDDAVEEGTIVELVSLDEFFKDKNDKIDIIKMDVEGSEFTALRGMKRIVEASAELKLFFEFNPHALIRQGAEIPSFLDLLYSLHFRLYYIDEHNKLKKPVSREWLLSYAENYKEGRYINLIGIRDISSD